MQSASAPGTSSNVNLIAASAGRSNFSSKFSTGASVFYVMDDSVSYEMGYGTLTTGSPDVLSRDTVVSNSAGTTARMNFAGTVRVYNEVPAASTIYKDRFGTVNLPVTSIVEPSNGIATVTLSNTGSSGACFKMIGNGAVTPAKTIRTQAGAFQVVNNAGSTAVLSLSDTGALAVANIDGIVGANTPAAVTATALTATTSLTVTDPTNGLTGITYTGAGTSGANFKITGNGATTPSKTIRVKDGRFDIINDIYNLAVLQLTDAGQLTVAGNVKAGLTAGGYLNKAGYSGTFGTGVFNFFWTGSVLQAWIDTSNVGSVSLTSDERYKHSIVALPDTALDRVMQLRPVAFRYADKGIFRDDGITREGLLAQDVEPIIASAVSGDDPKSLNPLPLIAVTVKALQELTHRVAALEAALNSQSPRVGQ